MLVSKIETHILLAAAGSGRRMGADVNKQFLEVAGLPIVVRAVRRCRNFLDSLPDGCPSGLHLICAAEEIDDMKALMAKHDLAEAVDSYVTGGRTRQESVYRGLLSLVNDDDKSDASARPDCLVMVHDAARCLTSPELFARCRNMAVLYGASCPGIPVQDTLRKSFALSGQDPVLYETVPREMLYRMQTPQCFALQSLLKANRLAQEKVKRGEINIASLTDDVSLAQLAGIAVRLVEGEACNIKITTPADIRIAEAYLKAGLV